MPLAYGTPSDELGPDSDTLRPTLRSAAIAPAVQASATAAPSAQRTKFFISDSWGWSGGELDRRQRCAGIQEVDRLEPDAPGAAALHEAVETAPGERHVALAAGFDVQERRAQLADVGVVPHHGRCLQHVLAAACRMLRMRPRALQALDAQLQQQA